MSESQVTSLQAPPDFCKCGHARSSHFAWLLPGRCLAQIDKRPVMAGGFDLERCPCEGYEPMVKVIR